MLAFIAILFGLTAGEPERAQVPELPKPKLICRSGEQELGSHMHTGRTCRTAEQWQQEDARRDQRPATYEVVPGQGDGVPRPPRPPL
jgi:hypothetical protein